MSQQKIESGIAIKRKFQFWNPVGIARKLGVFVDKTPVGGLSFGQRCVYTIDPGRHEVYVQMDWCRSMSLPIQVIELECGVRFRFWPITVVMTFVNPRRFFFVRKVSQ